MARAAFTATAWLLQEGTTAWVWESSVGSSSASSPAGWLKKSWAAITGLLTNLIVGVIGALLGGFISNNVFGAPVGGFNFVTLIVAFLGACLLLFLLGLVKRRA